jgi:hypothetical protein
MILIGNYNQKTAQIKDDANTNTTDMKKNIEYTASYFTKLVGNTNN